MKHLLLSTALGATALTASCTQDRAVPSAASAAAARDPALRCAGLADAMVGNWPDADTRIVKAEFREAGPAQLPPNPMGPPMPPPVLPAHCEIMGKMHERTGIDGQKYAINFHVRLPAEWNGKFFMSGGGGTNGNLGDAIGMNGAGPSALAQGYAVMSQDSGHDNATNSPPDKGGMTSFGMDPVARADYGGTSLPPTVLATKALVTAFYGAKPSRSYFVGCSKGGQEGMMLAQRYPELFDGIVAAAPGFSLPRAAVGEAWNTQAFATAAAQPVTLQSLARSFSDGDLHLARDAVLKACDADDGVADGIVGNYAVCTSAKVVPQLRAKTCSGEKTDTCLSTAQIDALIAVHDGPRDAAGKQLYPGLLWDAGWVDMGWRLWMIGSYNGGIPSLNAMMGGPALAQIFTTPPVIPAPGPAGGLAYAMGFDFDRDGPKLYATDTVFKTSAWQDIGARSPDIDAFAKRGGRMIVPHGVSDPAFSAADTIDWWNEVNARRKGKAADTVRVFPVPGMAHCQGGPAADGYDAFAALVDWVEKGQAPAKLDARAGPMSPWPGRTRPVCAYPKVARYKGGSIEDASSFACK